MSDFGFYTAKEMFEKEFESKEYLIDQFLHQKDCVILAGKAKTGKSVLLFQFICALTSGEKLFGEYEVKKKCKVLYIQLEGSLNDSQDRFKRMTQQLALDNDNFNVLFSPPLMLNDAKEMGGLIANLKTKMPEIDVIIIDPIYFAMQGSLADDEAVRNFTGQLRILQDTFNCAIILAHHFKKARRDKEGNVLVTDDDDVFGSVFFQAWITHQFLFDLDKVSKTRILQCNVQRSGKILDKLNLKMVEPEPLYFKLIDEFPTKGMCLAEFFRNNPGREFSGADIWSALNMNRKTFYREEKVLRGEGLTDRKKVNGEYVFFSLLERHGKSPVS